MRRESCLLLLKNKPPDFTRLTTVNRSSQVKSSNAKSRSTCAVLDSNGCHSKSQYFFSLRMAAKAQYFPGRLASVTTSWFFSPNTNLCSLENKQISYNASKMQAGTQACPHLFWPPSGRRPRAGGHAASKRQARHGEWKGMLLLWLK